jgi:hypothetical protein
MKKLALIAAAAGLTACAQGTPEINNTRRDTVRRERQVTNVVQADDLFSGSGTIRSLGGRMDGQFNNLAVNNDVYQHDYMDDGYTTSAHVYARGSGGTAMGILYVNGSVADLVPGQTYRASNQYYNEGREADAGELTGGFTECSCNTGDDCQGFTTDEPATDIEIVVEQPELGQQLPEGTLAELSVLAHWDGMEGYSAERTMKTRIFLTE